MRGAPHTLIALLAVACTGKASSTEGAGSVASAGGAAGQGAAAGNGGTAATGVGGAAGASSAPALVDEGLVARYFIDEAPSGQRPIELVDAAPDPVALPITYIPEMSFSEIDGHRGLRFDLEGLDGRAGVLADTTKFQRRLSGITAATVEIVLQVEGVSPSGSRFVYLGSDTDWWFTVATGEKNRALLSWNKIESEFYAPLPSYGRFVLHGVYETTQADAALRTRCYVNGGITAHIEGEIPAQNEVLTIPNGKHFVLGNREIGGRTFRGVLFYAAVYDHAFTDVQIVNNVHALLTSDDGPRAATR